MLRQIGQSYSSSLNLASTVSGLLTDNTEYLTSTVTGLITFNNNDATNNVITLDSNITIPASGGINLNGAGSDVIFTRLTGDTTAYGTIIVRLASDATSQKTITINQTGSISSN